jgi:tetratricopeptide (TPR) repeat protein
MKKDKAKDVAEARVVRVFVSSTFRDMQAERDELAKFIFPQLRKLCEQRGVTWGEVDLRWGITDEQQAEGKVLPICLDEIQRCRPYFIGLLGERYGWIPDEIPPELIEREPWLAEHLDQSVTELEILHGVLNDPEMADHTFFYYRDPAHIQSLPGKEQSVYREEPTAEDIEKFGSEEATRRAETRRGKLASLKERIRNSGCPLRENYRDARQLGEWVQEDLGAVIDRLYPEGSQPDPLDREAAEHDAFAVSRAKVYLGRSSYYQTLNEHVKGHESPLLISGEAGFGKSALLANWALRYRKQNPNDFLLMHFIGATPASTDWMAMLRRIIGEFKRRFNLEGDIPDQPVALRKDFTSWLYKAATKGHIILILDGLNQLEDNDQALDLVWLPSVIPENVSLLLSTLPGRPLQALEKRGCQILQVEPLKVEERRQLITEYLAYFAKNLSPARVERIAGTRQAENPLYLRVLLDELILFGSHERLDEYILHYLAAKTVVELYTLVLERYEQDYERERLGLVKEAMSLLWAARRGLSEVELLDMLGENKQPMPRAYWSPLYLAAEPELINRAGLIGFFHNFLRRAVEGRYLRDEQLKRSAHLRLADYFEGRESGMRRMEEQPWQLAQAKSWEKLFALLTNLDFFLAAWEVNEFEIKSFWTQVKNNSDLKIVNGYKKVLDHPDHYDSRVAWEIGRLLGAAGYASVASGLNAHLIETYRLAGNQPMLAAVLGMQANIEYHLGKLDKALEMHHTEEQICRELNSKGGLAFSLINQAPIFCERGDPQEALGRYQEAGRLFRELEDKRGLAKSLTGEAIVLSEGGDQQQALVLFKEAERLCREIGHQDELVVALVNQGNARFHLDDLEEASRLYQEAERMCRVLGNKEWLAKSLGNQANIRYRRRDLDGALGMYQEVADLCLELGDKNDLQIMLNNQARIFEERGEARRALSLYQEEERLCREMGNKPSLQNSLRCQAILIDPRGNPEDIMKVQIENERLCRELGNQRELAISLIHQAIILGQRLHQAQAALDKAGEAYQMAVRCGDASLARQIESLRRQLGGWDS